MKLVFLGTGAAEGIPGFRCMCLVCSEARIKKGKYIRQNSAVFLQSSGRINVLIDMPPQIKPLLEKNRINDAGLDVILLTHFHIDHTGGIFSLIESKQSSGHVPGGRPAAVYMPEDCYKTISESIYAGQPDIFLYDYSAYYSLNILKHLEKTDISGLKIQALDTNHLLRHSGSSGGPGNSVRRECHGYLFSENGKNTAYMTDASPELPESTIGILKEAGLDCLIYECTFGQSPDKRGGHTDHEGVLQIKEILKPERMIITHISHRNFGHEKLTDYMAGYGIETAWDGMRITV